MNFIHRPFGKHQTTADGVAAQTVCAFNTRRDLSDGKQPFYVTFGKLINHHATVTAVGKRCDRHSITYKVDSDFFIQPIQINGIKLGVILIKFGGIVQINAFFLRVIQQVLHHHQIKFNARKINAERCIVAALRHHLSELFG